MCCRDSIRYVQQHKEAHLPLSEASLAASIRLDMEGKDIRDPLDWSMLAEEIGFSKFGKVLGCGAGDRANAIA